jgi:flagellin-specific chaperone FliS
MRKDPYVEKLRLLYKAVAKLDNQMNAADRSRYSHVKKDFNKALKAVAELTSALNRKGATIPN